MYSLLRLDRFDGQLFARCLLTLLFGLGLWSSRPGVTGSSCHADASPVCCSVAMKAMEPCSGASGALSRSHPGALGCLLSSPPVGACLSGFDESAGYAFNLGSPPFDLPVGGHCSHDRQPSQRLPSCHSLDLSLCAMCLYLTSQNQNLPWGFRCRPIVPIP